MSESPRQAPEVRSVMLLTHSHPEQTTGALDEAIAAAERAGCVLAAPPEELAKHGDNADRLRPASELEGGPDLCLVLGGDGSILQALRRFAHTGVPVFGINFGTIGFLAATEGAELETGLALAFGGEFDVMPLPGLEIEIAGEPEVALNDVSFISLSRVLGPIASCVAGGGEILALVKPQFELGRGRVGKGGVVREAAERR